MIRVQWNNPGSGRSIDILDPAMFEDEGFEGIIEHKTTWLEKRGRYVDAFAYMRIEGRNVFLNYGHADVLKRNNAQEIDTGFYKFQFENDDRTRLLKAFWAKKDGASFEPLAIEVFDLADISDEEGDTHLVPHYRRERSRWLRDRKLEEAAGKGPIRCEACDERQAKYGERAVWEVHHRLPIGQGKRVTPLKDLAVLCPSCHRAIHRTEGLMSVEDFKTTL